MGTDMRAEIRGAVIAVLQGRESRRAVVLTDSKLRDELGLGHYSNTQFQKAVGGLVRDGVIIRSRQQPQHMGHEDLPVTYRLATA